MAMKQLFAILKEKNSALKNKDKEIRQPKAIYPLRKPKKLFSKKKKENHKVILLPNIV